MTTTKPTGSGEDKLAAFGGLSWNQSGWFGGVIGSSAWMLLSSALFFANGHLAAGVILLGGFAATVSLGTMLWYRREKLTAYRAMMSLLGALSVAVPAVYFSVIWLVSPEERMAIHWNTTPWVTLMVVGICPALMTMFTLRERAAQERFRRDGQTGAGKVA